MRLNGEAAIPAASYTNSALSDERTLLPWLGDVFVLPRPLPFANVFSIGDVLIGLGAVWFLVRAMHRRVPDVASASLVHRLSEIEYLGRR
jgi:hypothetical protein